MKRLTPDQIQPGRSYRLMPYYTPCRQLIRRVEAIQDGNVVVLVNGKKGADAGERVRGVGGGGSGVQGIPERRKNGTQCKVKVVYP